MLTPGISIFDNKKDTYFFASGLSIIIIKAYSHQTKSRISRPIPQYRGSDCSLCYALLGYGMHFNIQEFIVIAGELIIEAKRQCMLGANHDAIKYPGVD